MNPKITHHPREGSIGILPDTTEKVRSGGQIHAEVNAAQFMDAIEPIDPDRRLFEELLGFLVFAKEVFLIFLAFLTYDTIGMVRFIIHDENILFSPDLTPKNAINERRITLNIPSRLNRDLLQRTIFLCSSAITANRPAATCRSKSSNVR